MAKLFDPLSGIDVGGALTVGKLFYSRISKQIKLADYDELVRIAYSMSLCNSLSVGLNNKYAEIAQNLSEDRKKQQVKKPAVFFILLYVYHHNIEMPNTYYLNYLHEYLYLLMHV